MTFSLIMQMTFLPIGILQVTNPLAHANLGQLFNELGDHMAWIEIHEELPEVGQGVIVAIPVNTEINTDMRYL